ncbi:hypothetical protein B0T09DRAFT_368116 [Sordaria sp. MPI-SDFR-AT-0083]|nr:hypothetical protein B0T09DRAFT_368116 [Sordaria sp. MPI-SDFR-AT-0083]
MQHNQQHPQQFNHHGQQHQQGHQFPPQHQRLGGHQQQPQSFNMMQPAPGNYHPQMQMQMQMPPSQAPYPGGPPRRPRIFAQSFNQENNLPQQQFFGQPQSQSQAPQQHFGQQSRSQVAHPQQQRGQVFNNHPQQAMHHQQAMRPQQAQTPQQHNGQVFHRTPQQSPSQVAPQQHFGQQSQSQVHPQQQNGQVFNHPRQAQAPQQQQQRFHHPQQQAMHPQQQAMFHQAQAQMNFQQQQRQQQGVAADPNLTSNDPMMNSLGSDSNIDNFDLGDFEVDNVDFGDADLSNFDFNDFGGGNLQGQQQQSQNVISQNAVNWPSENLVQSQASHAANHGRNNSLVSLMTPSPSVDNSYGGAFVNSSPADNSFNTSITTPAATPKNSFCSFSPANNVHNSPNTSPVAESSNSSADFPVDDPFNNQPSQVANHSRANSSVALTPPHPPADNSYGQAGDNNVSLDQALLDAFNNSPELPSSFTNDASSNSPGQASHNSANTNTVADAPNTSTDSAAEDFSAGSPSGNTLNSFDSAPVQDSSAGFDVQVADNNFSDNNLGDLSGSFVPASENQHSLVDLTDDNVAFGQGMQIANNGQVDPFTSFASPAENHQQQAFNFAQEHQFNAHQQQAFFNAPGVQSDQQYGSPQIPSNPLPAEQTPTPAAKTSTRKKAALPKKPAAKRPAAKRTRKTKAPANNEPSEDVDDGAIGDADDNEYLWGAELQPNEYSYDLDDSLRTFSDSVPQRNVSTMNGNLPLPALADNGIAPANEFIAPANNFENGTLIAPHPGNTYIAPASNGIENDPIAQVLDRFNEEQARLQAMAQQTQQVSIAISHILDRLTNTDQKPQLTIDVNLQAPARSPPNKRKRGNTASTPAVQETAPAPKRRRVAKPRAKAKGSLSKSASSAKFGLGKGAGTGLNSPRTMYVFDEKAFYLIPASIMPAFLNFVNTPIERPIEQQPPAPPVVQQQDFSQQQPAPVEQQFSTEQQQSFDQQLPTPVLQQDTFQQDDWEPAYDVEGRLLTLLQDDEANEQNMWNDDDASPSSLRQPVPLSEAAIAFGITNPSTLHSQASTSPVQNPPHASSSPAPAPPAFGPGSEFPFSRKPKPFGSDLDKNGAVILDPNPERSYRSVPNNREIIEKFSLAPIGRGTERDVSHLDYFIDLARRSGLLTCGGDHEEIPGAFRWESWKTAEENLLALRPFLGTYSTRDWFTQWEAKENPIQIAEREEEDV